MKLDLLNNKWLDIVFEGRNKKYGAYELRKDNTKTNVRAFIIGAVIFSFAVATPLLLKLIPDSSNEENGFHQVVTWNKVFDGKSGLDFALFCPNDMMFVLWTFHFRLALLCVRTRHEDEK